MPKIYQPKADIQARPQTVRNPIVPHVLQWNRLNGSGPVSNQAFIKRNAHLVPGDHTWVFAAGNRT